MAGERGKRKQRDARAIGGDEAASAILAGFQQLLGDALFLHPRSIAAGASGFFANQNSQATFLAICVFGLAAMTARSGKVDTIPTVWASLVAGLLAVGTLLSGSRMGFALFIVAALAATCLLAMRRHAKNERRRSLAGRIGTAAALAMFFLARFAQVLGENGDIPAWFAAWVPPAVGALAALGRLLRLEDG